MLTWAVKQRKRCLVEGCFEWRHFVEGSSLNQTGKKECEVQFMNHKKCTVPSFFLPLFTPSIFFFSCYFISLPRHCIRRSCRPFWQEFDTLRINRRLNLHCTKSSYLLNRWLATANRRQILLFLFCVSLVFSLSLQIIQSRSNWPVLFFNIGSSTTSTINIYNAMFLCPFPAVVSGGSHWFDTMRVCMPIFVASIYQPIHLHCIWKKTLVCLLIFLKHIFIQFGLC